MGEKRHLYFYTSHQATIIPRMVQSSPATGRLWPSHPGVSRRIHGIASPAKGMLLRVLFRSSAIGTTVQGGGGSWVGFPFPGPEISATCPARSVLRDTDIDIEITLRFLSMSFAKIDFLLVMLTIFAVCVV
jgi:hypothetical protein